MNNKTKMSSLARVKEVLVSLRKKYGLKNRFSMCDCAHNAGLPVEYLENLPSTFEGFLDWNHDPSFIAVNRNLPPHDQAFFIARQIATCAQKRRCNSLVLNRPWKWEMFEATPAGLKEKIGQLDIEFRAHCLMLYFATGDEFRAFIRADPKRLWCHASNDNIVWYHLSILRTKLWFTRFCRKIATVAFPSS